MICPSLTCVDQIGNHAIMGVDFRSGGVVPLNVNRSSNKEVIMEKKILAFMFGLVAMLAFVSTSQAGGSCDYGKSAKADVKPDIVDTAVSAGSFTTLVAALEGANLVDTLKGDGPFTVFAPTDEAFAKLPEGTVAELLKPENKDKLTAILTYHVVPGKVLASDVANMKLAKTVNGKSLSIDADASGVRIDNANVAKADIITANGVIHVIDEVVIPQ